MKNDNHGFVYEWTNKINGKKYIGSHKGNENDKYVGSGIYFTKAYKKYSKENFERKILYRGDDYKLFEEQKLKENDALNNISYYNLKNEAVGGAFYGNCNGMYNKHHKKSSLEKMSKTAKQNYTKERKLKHSNDIKGKNNPMYGKTYQARGIISRAKENKGKTYEEIFGTEKAEKIKNNMSISRKNKKQNWATVKCVFCRLEGRGPNMTRYHFNNCKNKIIEPQINIK